MMKTFRLMLDWWSMVHKLSVSEAVHGAPRGMEPILTDLERRREYWNAVQSIASECIENAREYDREISDVVWEAVDGSRWVIYYHLAARVCLYSSNDGALFDEMGSDALNGCASIGEVHTRCAFYALLADVQECIAGEMS